MNDVNMAAFTAPKSDQLNADDLIGGPRTVTVTAVRANAGSAEQPVDISFEGDDGKPYKPCKSMRRVMVHVWGADAKNYIGRSMTLYCDPAVQFGGMKVGGIRISHMSHIDKAHTMALTATRAKRAPFTVQPLIVVDVEALIAQYVAVNDQAAFDAAEIARGNVWKSLSKDDKAALKAASDEAKERAADPS
jgi:hypothetical protein